MEKTLLQCHRPFLKGSGMKEPYFLQVVILRVALIVPSFA